MTATSISNNTIATVKEQVPSLPEPLRQIGERIYQIDVMQGRTIVPPLMEPWVEKHFGDVAAVREQTIVKIVNRFTLESALFNPVRAHRPNADYPEDDALEAWITQELTGHDVFTDPEHETTADIFGRIRGRYCLSASNVAKYDGWHGLVIFDDPHPLHPGPAQIADFLEVALRWFAAAHAADPGAIYPLITWNCLPKSGATLMHGHMQLALTRGLHFARIENWRRAAEAYRTRVGAAYLDDLYALHEALGLAVPAGNTARGFVHLTPVRNREVVLLASTAEDMIEPFAANVRALIERQGVRAFNAAIALPPLLPTAEDWRDMAVVARVGDRGNPLTNRNDIGAMELFAASCITTDPYRVARELA